MSDLKFHQDKTVVLNYLAQDEIDSHVRQFGDRIACVIGFGRARSAVANFGLPTLWVDTPVAGSDAVYEVWTANTPLTRYRDGLISGAGNGDVFFGCLSFPTASGGDLAESAQRGYSAIFENLQRSAYPNLLRVWNYFPSIGAIEGGVERYHSFCVGRHEAFARYNRKVEDSPAASVLGSHGGPMVIYFLASRHPGVQIENPRQTSAYNYPKEYGPRSPIFSRATLAFQGASQTLFISGTASILGHVSVHPGSVALQARETLANIRAVIEQAGKAGFKFGGGGSGVALKVYVRNSGDIGLVRDIIVEEWGAAQKLILLQADICRSDLLMEVEAVCWGCAD